MRPRRGDRDEGDVFDGVTFTPEQRKRILRMLESFEWSTRFWKNVGLGSKWVAGALTAAVAFKILFGEYLAKLFRL